MLESFEFHFEFVLIGFLNFDKTWWWIETPPDDGRRGISPLFSFRISINFHTFPTWWLLRLLSKPPRVFFSTIQSFLRFSQIITEFVFSTWLNASNCFLRNMGFITFPLLFFFTCEQRKENLPNFNHLILAFNSNVCG